MPGELSPVDIEFGEFADPKRVIADCLQGLLPPKRINVADWAAENRYLNNSGGGYVGRWSHDVAPYLKEPMERFTSRHHDCIVMPGPGQSAKTTIAENAFLHAVPNRPAKWLWYMQSEATVQAYVKDRIDPMIESHPCLYNNLGLRPIDDSLKYKRFKRMMRAEFLAANRANLISKSAPIIVADEIDAYPKELGDVKQHLDVRRQTFGLESMLFCCSHPDRAEHTDPKGWNAGIMLLYADSTQARWWWACPHCGEYSSPNPGAEYEMKIAWDNKPDLDETAETAHMICPRCGSVEIFDEHRHAMNLTGKWVHRGQSIAANGDVSGEMIPSRTLGFWLVGSMSPFVRDGIRGLVRARVKAERDRKISGDEKTLKEVLVKQWGIPWGVKASEYDQPIEVSELLERVESYPIKTVPVGTRFLVAWADVQASRFSVLVVAFGPAFEAWPIERFELFKSATGDRPVNPATRLEDWDLLLTECLRKTYPLADGSGRKMAIVRMGVDSAGVAGVTAKAYDFWRKCKKEGLAPRVILTKGASSPTAPRVAERLPDSARKDRKAKAQGEVPVWLFNTNAIKDEIDAALRTEDSGPGYFHLSKFFMDDQPPHLFFEELTAEARDKNEKWVRTKDKNEAFDQAVGTRVVALSLKADRIKWGGRVPNWAKPWPDNSFVLSPEGDEKPAPTRKRGRRVISKGIG